MNVVYVTNLSDADHVDKHGGVTYEFKKGVTVEVPEQVASDCFGYGHHNKEQFVVRLGWSKTSNDMPQALQRLSQFDISAEKPTQDRYLPSAVGEVTPLPVKAWGRKANSRAA